MTVALYTNVISPHQLPFAEALCTLLGKDAYRYIYTDDLFAERANMGWNEKVNVPCIKVNSQEAREWLEACNVLICGQRDLALIERRCENGKLTFYASERWYKPVYGITGRVRMLVPSYRRMVRRFVFLTKRFDNFRVLAYGVHARADFELMGVPEDKISTWGYFVAPSDHLSSPSGRIFSSERALRVLWVGRMMRLKNVDVIIRAIRQLRKVGRDVQLTLVGDGAEKSRLQHLSAGLPVEFRPPVPIEEVRSLMRAHDVYVFPSNGMDGWGAVVSEALEEGMIVLGSHEAGATATILPEHCRFACRDHHRLAELLCDIIDHPECNRPLGIGEWSAKAAACRFVGLCK